MTLFENIITASLSSIIFYVIATWQTKKLRQILLILIAIGRLLNQFVISLWIRAIICMIDSSPCLNRSDRRLDMINPVILLARCCKSLKFAFSGCFTMLAGIWLGFSIRWLESLFLAFQVLFFLLLKLEWKPCDCPPFFCAVRSLLWCQYARLFV